MKIDAGERRMSRNQSSKGLFGTGQGPNPAGFSTLRRGQEEEKSGLVSRMIPECDPARPTSPPEPAL